MAARGWRRQASALVATLALLTPHTIGAQSPTPTRTPTPINLGNFVWDDLDQDGRQDPGEPGLSGVAVQLWNSTKTQLLSTDVTDMNGFYTVVAPIPGNYRVRVVLPGINDQFSPKDNGAAGDNADSDFNPSGSNLGFTDIIAIASNVISIVNIDAGIIKFRTPTPTRTPTPVNIGNFVWDDLDQDGRQDPGEPGLAGVTVQLWNSAKTVLISSDVTDVNGIYSVVSPGAGQFRVRVVLPNINDSFSVKNNAAAGDNADSDFNPSGTSVGFTDIISIASNVISITNIDAGIIRFRTPTPTRTPTPINVTMFVWRDLDEDGRQDVGEPGLLGVTVRLYNSTRTVIFDEKVTNASGIATLVAPLPGSYRVRVLRNDPSDSFSPKDNAAAGDLLDSDINAVNFGPQVTPNFGYTDVYTFASNLIAISSIDAGIITDFVIQGSPAPSGTHTPPPTDTPPPPASATPTNTYDIAEPTWTSTPTATHTGTASPSPTSPPRPTEVPTPREGLPCNPGDGCADGQPCGEASECASGFCADGVCCSSACTDDGADCNRPANPGLCISAAPAPALSPFSLALGGLLLTALAAWRIQQRRSAARG